jgi:GT2 family glycosyltransferase
MDLSIIVVTYRSEALIVDCFRSLTTHTKNISYELIVVNNGDLDEGRDLVMREFPQVRWVNQGYNSGFARANNAGIKAALAKTVLLLNPDTLLQDNSIAGCYREFTMSSHVACGVQLRNADNSPQISGSYAFKGGLNYLLPLPYVGASLKYIAEIFGASKPHIPNVTDTGEVDWINGAFLMVKKEVIARAGLLDEDFFLYAEESEWCSRLRKFGSLCIYGRYHAIHLEGESSNKAFNATGKGYADLVTRKGLQIMLSNMVRIRKEFGTGWFLFMLTMYSFGAVINWVLGLFNSLFSNKTTIRSHIKNANAFIKNVFVIWSLSGRIVQNRPYFYKVL